jgi:hypothetical protein
MSKARLAAVLALACLVAPACYNPNIKSGALKCAENHACPDNFHCIDGLCYRGDAGPDVPPAPVCNSVTPDAGTCPRLPAAGEACNPTCETGCTCGWCGLDITGAVKCLMGTPGTKPIGTVCDPANANDCAPGLYCRAECGAARCYKFCDTKDDCSGTSCSISLPSGLHLCALPDPGCDPIMKTGCAPGFACYPSGARTECDCGGTADAGTTCVLTNTCMPGYQCVATNSSGMNTSGACQKLCRVNGDCGGARTCVTSGTTYGYCTP